MKTFYFIAADSFNKKERFDLYEIEAFDFKDALNIVIKESNKKFIKPVNKRT